MNHTDILGQPLTDGSYVATSHHNTLYICQVKKITPKMIRVSPVKGGYGSDGWLKYPSDLVVLSGSDVLAYILKHSGSN